MKNVYRSLAVVVCLLALGSTASAFDIGGAAKGAVKGAAKDGSKKVVESQINKNLKEKNCSFKPKTIETTCDIDSIVSTFNAQRQIAKQSGFASDVDINVSIGQGKDPKNPNLGSQRIEFIRNKLKGKVSYWSWYDATTTGDQLTFTVKIR